MATKTKLGSLAMRAQAARQKNDVLSRSEKRAEIMDRELQKLKDLIMSESESSSSPFFEVACFYQPLCIKDDYGKEHIVPRECCYAWLPDTDPETDAITWSEMLTGVYNAKTGKTEPHRLPYGRTLVARLNDWLEENRNPLLVCLEKSQDSTYIRYDNKRSTKLRIVAVRDTADYIQQRSRKLSVNSFCG